MAMSWEKVRGCPRYLEQKDCKYRKSKTHASCHGVPPAPEAVNCDFSVRLRRLGDTADGALMQNDS